MSPLGPCDRRYPSLEVPACALLALVSTATATLGTGSTSPPPLPQDSLQAKGKMDFMALSLLALAIGLLAINLIFTAMLLKKTTRIDQRTWSLREDNSAALDSLYRQFESLIGLYAELQPVRGLPGTRGWAASPDFLLHLARTARDQRPDTIVECSCGTSTIVLARICQINGQGHVYSLEHEAQFANITREHLRRLGLDEWATVVDAPIKQSSHSDTPWYDTASLNVGTIDLLVVDGPPAALAPQARFPAGPHLFDRLAPRGLVFVDDADRPDERALVQRWQQAFPGLRRSELPAEKGLVVLTVDGSSARG